MPFNGSGTFIPIIAPNYPAVAGQPVYASQFNANMTDLFSGFTNCVTRDGQSPATANLPIAGFKLTNVGLATVLGDALSFGRSASVSNLIATGGVAAPGVLTNEGILSRYAATWIDTTRAADGKTVEWIWDSGVFQGRFVNDLYSNAQGFMAVVGNSTTITSLDFGGLNFRVAPVAGAVNYLQAAGATAANKPTFSAVGSDAAISWTMAAKGTGQIITASALRNTTSGVSSGGDVASTYSLWGTDKLLFVDSTRTANNKQFEWNWSSGQMEGRFVNDAYGAATSGIIIQGGQAAGTNNVRIYNDANVIALRVEAGFCNIGTAAATYNSQVTGAGQGVAAMTDAGAKGSSLYLLDTSTAGAGQGGALLFGAFNSSKPFAGIKGLITDAANNTRGDIGILGRRVATDAALTENWHFGFDGRLYATAIHNNASGAGSGSASTQYIASGTYTPAASTLSNLSVVTPGTAQWLRVGNVVTVSGSFSSTASVANTFTSFQLSLPLSPVGNFAALDQCGGSMTRQSGAGVQYNAGSVQAAVGNVLAQFAFTVGATITSNSGSYTFTYLIS